MVLKCREMHQARACAPNKFPGDAEAAGRSQLSGRSERPGGERPLEHLPSRQRVNAILKGRVGPVLFPGRGVGEGVGTKRGAARAELGKWHGWGAGAQVRQVRAQVTGGPAGRAA